MPLLASNVVAAPENARSRKFVMVLCRDLTPAETQLLNRYFPKIIVYNHGLNSSEMKLETLDFDLLVLDERQPEHHLFLEIVKPSADRLGIPFIVIKRRFSNSRELAVSLDAFVLSAVEDLPADNFFMGLVKSKLPKLKSPWMILLKKVFGLLLG